MAQKSAADVDGRDVTSPARVGSAVPPAPGRNADFQFTADQIEKARREERDKLNGKTKKLKAENDALQAELKEFRQFKEQFEAQKQAEEERAAAAVRAAEEAEMSAKDLVARRAEELEAKLTARDTELRQKFAQLELERKAVHLQGYIATRVAQEQAAKTIAPQFIKYIDGTTEEEVEASIEQAKADTAEILTDVAGGQDSAPRGPSLRTGPTDFGTHTETQDDGVDYENMSFADYMKLRPKLGMGSSGGQGIFQ